MDRKQQQQQQQQHHTLRLDSGPIVDGSYSLTGKRSVRKACRRKKNIEKKEEKKMETSKTEDNYNAF